MKTKKITAIEDGYDIEIFITADGRGFRIHDLGGEGEEVLEQVSVDEASSIEEAVTLSYIERNTRPEPHGLIETYQTI